MLLDYKIRPAEIGDIEQILEIYSKSIANETASWEYDAPDIQEFTKRYNDIINNGFSFIVAEANNIILGYAYISSFRTRIGYRYTVEDSIYLNADYYGKGIGTALLNELIKLSKEKGFKQLIAVIGDIENQASINLHKKCGFRHIGIMPKVGYKFDKWLDSILMQREL